MRRLPIYIVIDSSLCGLNDGLKLKEALKYQLSQLKNDPYAMEIAALCLIINNSRPRIIPDLEMISNVDWDKYYDKLDFQYDNSTGIQESFRFLKSCLEHDIVSSNRERKGDFYPMIIVAYNSCRYQPIQRRTSIKNWSERMFDFVENSVSSVPIIATEADGYDIEKNIDIYYWNYQTDTQSFMPKWTS